MVDADAYQLRLRAIAKIRKLMAMARDGANENESALALSRAEELAARHDIDMATLKPGADKKKVDLGAFKAAMGAISSKYPGPHEEDEK